MTIQDLGALGELLGAVAVLATLIYLALQTRQNTMAIAAQLDAAALSAQQYIFMTAATSTELQEALAEDRISDVTINQVRRNTSWHARITRVQWECQQARRGLLPSFNEAGVVDSVRQLFGNSRSFERWWERVRARLSPEFVEWVEEQRAKAA